MSEYRRRKPAYAMQYDGSDESAATVMMWGSGLPEPLEIVRCDRVGVGGALEQEPWLEVRHRGCWLVPGEWIVSDGDVVDVYTTEEFEAQYERAVTA